MEWYLFNHLHHNDRYVDIGIIFIAWINSIKAL